MKAYSNSTSRYPLSLSYSLIAALLIWLVFYPGIFSLDSFFMVFEATSGLHSDAHSPLLPFILSFVLKFAGDLGIAMLIPIVAGFLGLRRLVIALLSFFGADHDTSIDIKASIILLLLSLPLTQLSIYLATLWTDTWLATLLLWILAFMLELYQAPLQDSEKQLLPRIWPLLLLIALAILIRQNAVVMYPALGLCVAWVLREKPLRPLWRVFSLLFPLVIFLLFWGYQYGVLKIMRAHTEQVSFALDFASMVIYDPSICQDLSLEGCDMVLDVFPPDFVVGNGAIDLAPNQGILPNKPFYDLLNYPDLGMELLTAINDHPVLFATIKLLNFMDYIRPDSARYFYQRHNPEEYAHPFAPLTNSWFSITDWVLRDPLLRWFSFVHALWLMVNLFGLLICVWLVRRYERARFLGMLLMVPASYYASYLIALTASEFRFMYPSTLVMQVITLTWLFSRRTLLLQHGSNKPPGSKLDRTGENRLSHRPESEGKML
jgi:hypothetical protein